MKNIRISAKEILSDIKAGMSDAALMEKYGLSVRSLPKVKEELMKLGLAGQGEIGPRDACPVSAKIAVNARDFVKSFDETPDDFVLMEKYFLSSKQLQQVYERLLEKGLLTEYEFHGRDRKSPELKGMELPEIEDSTAVDLTQGLREALREGFHTETEHTIGRPIKRELWIEEGPGQSTRSEGRCSQTPSGFRPGPCPGCGKPKTADSPDTCPYCGVVFAKVKVDTGRARLSVWD